MASAQDTDPWVQFELEKKNPILAGALEAVVPFAGNAYAGNWKSSIGGFVFDVAGWALVAGSSNLRRNCGPGSTSKLCEYDPDDVQAWGLGTVFFAIFYRVYTARNNAHAFNENLMRRLGIVLNDVDLNISPAPGGMSIGVSIPLGR